MKSKPVSPNEIEIELPSEVIDTINAMIKEKYRGGEFSFKQKDLIAMGPKYGVNGDWFKEKWIDFEDVYRKEGWIVEYTKPDYTENFDAYFTFKPKK